MSHDHTHIRTFHKDNMPPGFWGLRHRPRRGDWALFIVTPDRLWFHGWYASERNATVGGLRYLDSGRCMPKEAAHVRHLQGEPHPQAELLKGFDKHRSDCAHD